MRLPAGNRPWPVGSGKFGTPFLRIHAAKRESAFAASACWARVSVGGPPPGRNLRHACVAAWNCDEFGSAPLIVTPAMLMLPAGAEAAEPTEAWNPCEVMQLAKALGLDFVGPAPEVEVAVSAEVVVRRLATEGDFEPPQPAAKSSAPVATTSPPTSSTPANLRCSRIPSEKSTTLKRL